MILLSPCLTSVLHNTTYLPLLLSEGTPQPFKRFRYACYVKDKSIVFTWLNYTDVRESAVCPPLPYDPVTASVVRRTGNLASLTSKRSRSDSVDNWLTAVRNYTCAASCNCSARRSKRSLPRACLRIEWRRGREALAAFVGRGHPCPRLPRHSACAIIFAVFIAMVSSADPVAAAQRT